MKKDFAEKKFTNKQTSRAGVRWIFLLVIFVILFSGVGFFVYKHKKPSLDAPIFSAYFSRITTWIAERKNHLPTHAANQTKSRPVSANKGDARSQIHFEFYTALPSMRVVISDPVANASNTASPLTERATEKPKDLAVKAASLKAQKTPRVKNNPVAIVDEKELEQDLSDHLSDQIKQNEYIVQLGIFKNPNTAERFRASLSDTGFNVKVTKIINPKREVYRVQAGPFSNKDQAKGAQRLLQKKGINGILKFIG